MATTKKAQVAKEAATENKPVELNRVKARYVKIVMNNCNTEWGYSIKELEVFESENVAFGKTVTSSSDHSAPYVGQKVTDGDLIGDPGKGRYRHA